MPDGSSKQNYINLDIQNFNIEEKGDLKDMVENMVLEDIGLINEGDAGETIPTL